MTLMPLCPLDPNYALCPMPHMLLCLPMFPMFIYSLLCSQCTSTDYVLDMPLCPPMSPMLANPHMLLYATPCNTLMLPIPLCPSYDGSMFLDSLCLLFPLSYVLLCLLYPYVLPVVPFASSYILYFPCP